MQVSPMSQTYMFTGLAVTVGALAYAWKTQQSAKSASDKEISRENPIVTSSHLQFNFSFAFQKITILYGTQFGTSKRFARRLLNQAKTKLPVNAYFQLKRMDQFDPGIFALVCEKIFISERIWHKRQYFCASYRPLRAEKPQQTQNSSAIGLQKPSTIGEYTTHFYQR